MLREVATFHLIGFSFGGAVAAAIASGRGGNLSKVKRLSLLSPAGFGQPVGRDTALEKVGKRPDWSEREIREATARNLGRWMLFEQQRSDDQSVDIHLCNVEKARFDSRKISHQDSLARDLLDIKVPVQVVLGEEDALIFPTLNERIRAFYQVSPQVELSTVSGAGHWVQYEASTAVNELLIKFHFSGE
ncbi:hypothetical protein AN416_38350 (plasmid) [Paraburkholderia caribensis]|nr:hypothetical protein AN416_38350 [Paraburkholderia caribensis]